MPINVDYLRVELKSGGVRLPRVQMRDRRAAGEPEIYWVFQRHLERILYDRSEGGTSGAIWTLLNETGMGQTAFCVSPGVVGQGHVSRLEYKELLEVFKACTDHIDPSSLGRIRSFTLLPMNLAKATAEYFGRSPPSIAFFRALQHDLPHGWNELEERDEDAAAGGRDLALEERIHEMGLEAEETTLAQELTETVDFTPIQADDVKMTTYTLERVSVPLQRELDEYRQYRSATFCASREGVKVASATSNNDIMNLKRFFGFLDRTGKVPEGAALRLSLLARKDLDQLAERYMNWLTDVQGARFSSIHNYLNGVVMVTNYVYETMNPPAETLALDPTPLVKLLRLRDQASGNAKEQGMFDKRVCGAWMTWEEAQETRVKVMATLAEQGATLGHAQYCRLLRDAVIISLLTLLPPDRVGVVRKLRFGHTLKRCTDNSPVQSPWLAVHRVKPLPVGDDDQARRMLDAAAVGERFAVYDVPEGKSPEDDDAWRPSVMQRTTMDSWTYYDVDCKEDLEHQSHDGDEGVLAEFGLYIRAPTPEEAPPLPSSGWRIDLTKRKDGHKTSKFYGPSNTKLPKELTPVLDAYAIALGYEKKDEFDFAGIEAYLFHPIRSDSDRALESSGWTQHVKGVFLKHAGKDICPRTLRSIFVTWLRDTVKDHDDAPAVLRSAAHAMKHSEATQAGTYDTRREERLNEAAFEYTLDFAKKYPCAALPDVTEALGSSGGAPATPGPSPARPTPGSGAVPATTPGPASTPRRSSQLPPGWECKEHVTAKSKYKRYYGPNGEKMSTMKAMWAHLASRPDAVDEEEEEEPPPPEEDVSQKQFIIERVFDARLSDSDSSISDKVGQLEMLVRWEGTDDNGAPFPDQWIPASWATPAARRDAKAILHRKKIDAARAEPELSALEQQREANVQRNEEYLRSIGLGSASSKGKAPANPKPARDGRFPRPPGRTPLGQRWDPVVGQWVDAASSAVPVESTETDEQQVHRVFETLHGPEAHNVATTQAEAVAGNWRMAEEGRATRSATAENNTQLLLTREAMEERSEIAAQAVAAEESARSNRRAARPPSRLELGTGPASKWKRANEARYKSLHAFAEFEAPGTDYFYDNDDEADDEFSTGGFQVGDDVDALGLDPSGCGRKWFCARVVGIRAAPAWPPITVKYISTLEGGTTSLELPSPTTAHLPATDVRLPKS